MWLLYVAAAGGAYLAYKKLYHPTESLTLGTPSSDRATAVQVEKSLPAENRTELQMFFVKGGILAQAKSASDALDMVNKLGASLDGQGYHVTAKNIVAYGTSLPELS